MYIIWSLIPAFFLLESCFHCSSKDVIACLFHLYWSIFSVYVYSIFWLVTQQLRLFLPFIKFRSFYILICIFYSLIFNIFNLVIYLNIILNIIIEYLKFSNMIWFKLIELLCHNFKFNMRRNIAFFSMVPTPLYTLPYNFETLFLVWIGTNSFY